MTIRRIAVRWMAVRRMAARSSCRLLAAAALIAVSGALAGCSTGSNDFDPTSLLDGFDTKKKLPGNREPVFPSGVPGLEQGVPRELYKENVDRQQLQGQDAVPVEPAPPPAAEAPKPKASSRPRAAPPRASAPAAATPPASKPTPRTVHRRSTTVPPPDAETPAAAPQPQAQPPAAPPPASNNPFPAPLPSGSFQRQ